MSSGSYFNILIRNVNDKKISDNEFNELLNQFKDNYVKNLIFSNNIDKNNISLPDYLPNKYDNFDDDTPIQYISVSEKYMYDVLYSSSFISSFTVLKNYFNLNPYSTDGSMREFSLIEVDKIINALKYILDENYSKQIEYYMDNSWIDILGEEYAMYYKWKNKTKVEKYWEDESSTFFKTLYNTLTTFYTLSNNNDNDQYVFKLVYNVY